MTLGELAQSEQLLPLLLGMGLIFWFGRRLEKTLARERWKSWRDGNKRRGAPKGWRGA